MNSENIEADYLNPDNESDNDSVMSDNPAAENYEACKAAAKEWKEVDADFSLIEQALLAMKSVIYLEVFQNGDTVKVHDTERLNDYVNICGNIYRHLTTGEVLDEYNTKIDGAIAEFINVYNANQPVTLTDKRLLQDFLHLHLICFCYCHNSDCLSMDDVGSDSE